MRQLQAAFAAAWAEATGELVSSRLLLDRWDGGVQAAGLLSTAPTLGSTPAERFLALSIAGARRTLYVTNAYFAPDRNFTGLLVEAARRGVDVRVLVGGPRTEVRAARLAARARYDALLSAGVRVHEYQPSTLHAKTFVVDGWEDAPVAHGRGGEAIRGRGDRRDHRATIDRPATRQRCTWRVCCRCRGKARVRRRAIPAASTTSTRESS
ncbi:MAG: phospholipase D-like domain-containing protein [Gemmatimonadaceae bacterium]